MGIIDRLKKGKSLPTGQAGVLGGKTEESEDKKSAKLIVKKKEPVEGEVVKKTAKKSEAPMHSIAYSILLHPVLSEKSAIHESKNSYTFAVAAHATKLTVKRAVKDVYGVTPVKVNIINMAGKIVRSGRVQGRRNGVKKALVTLKKGETISIHEGV